MSGDIPVVIVVEYELSDVLLAATCDVSPRSPTPPLLIEARDMIEARPIVVSEHVEEGPKAVILGFRLNSV